MRIPLSPRQKEILDFLIEYVRKNGTPPTRRAIAREFSISVSSAQKAVVQLDRKNYLTLYERERNGIGLAEDLAPR